ncbi:EF-hand domain-containing protein [Saccharopolyspora sp. ASAGF58]|uniref:EF-hand domain-containing protein n=1 Tax=Saccharopolyspora sp. ASAGF58 TaxID=2719023 RepID=UPI0014400F49|nr:EF-hand domain-containing protein [Saccharopolyspora sp. ASAGF58]QIZ38851.1 EF-hand domain-containing protein [Saccharopolyspora sp. ASAGF58]
MTTTVATERLQKRFAKWDHDGSGRLERADFEQEAAQIAQAFGKSVDSADVQPIKNALIGLFEYVDQEAGSNGRVTEEQFIGVTEKLIFEKGEAEFNRALTPVVQGIVALCDKNGDGKINGAEFATWLTALGMDESQAAAAFQGVDKDGNGELSTDELLAAVRDYHFGLSDVELLG